MYDSHSADSHWTATVTSLGEMHAVSLLLCEIMCWVGPTAALKLSADHSHCARLMRMAYQPARPRSSRICTPAWLHNWKHRQRKHQKLCCAHTC